MLADGTPGFDTHDVFLLAHFTSTTSTNLIGSQSIWVGEVLQLALQVGIAPINRLRSSSKHYLITLTKYLSMIS